MIEAGSSSAELLAGIRQLVADLRGVQPTDVGADQRFRDLGIDSRLALSLLSSLSGGLKVALPVTAIWQHATPRALAMHLAGLSPASPPAVARSRPALVVEPVAVVGLGCRLPGGISGAAELWQALIQGRDAIIEVPPARWNAQAWLDLDVDAPGKMTTRWGGFIEDVSHFDAAFFGISPREATQMDPQQRLALEVAWEALEDARVPGPSLAESRTGVFFGAMWQEYGSLIGADAKAIERHSATGWDNSIIPARIAYSLGLRGPAIAVNTACSSALVAIHLAAQSLERHECDLVLAGGVNLMLTPRATVQMTKFGAMNPAGQCRPFDAGANGYVRGEGCGVVVLKRLSDALSAGDRIYAVVHGSALNQDGASNGLTAPSPTAQAEVIREAWAKAQVPTHEISYVEAHGPGTILGDPIEALGLGMACSTDRAAALLIGSIKSNLGHLEAAAGVAGLLKTVLSLHHGALPATLHFERPSPHIPFESLKLQVVDRLQPWPRSPRRWAGVSSFGFGGTNAHVALGEGPFRRRALVPLAAASEELLRARARALVGELLEIEQDAELRSLPSEPSAGPVRVVLSAHHPEALEEAAKEVVKKVTRLSRIPEAPPRIVWVFSGQGGQWPGMARDLWAGEPAFRAAFAECDRAIKDVAGWSIIGELLASEARSRLGRTEVVQPLLFAVQVSLARTLTAFGITPDLVLGQSMGEVAAAVVAGALSVRDGAKIMCTRSALATARAAGQGAMAVVSLSHAEAEACIAKTGGQASIAVYLSPGQVILSGERGALDALLVELSSEGVQVDRVAVDYASHCAAMDPLLPELIEQLAELRPRAARLPLWSTVSDGLVSGAELDATYWARNLREPVRLSQGIAALAAERPTCFVEVGPHPVVLRSIEAALLGQGPSSALATCWREEPARTGLEDLAAVLWCQGATVDWDAVRGLRSTAVAEPVRGAPLLLSAHTDAALREQATRWAERLESGVDWVGLRYTAAVARAQLECRAAVSAQTVGEAAMALRLIADGRTPAGSSLATRRTEGGLAIVFSGQGSQRAEMGRSLAASSPYFGEALSEVCAALDLELGRSLEAILFAPRASPEAKLLGQTAYAQPAIFALEVALFRALETLGLRPDFLLGHSVGELAAAHVAGVLSLGDAARLVCARGRLMQACVPDGAMLAVAASEAEVAALLASAGSQVEIAGSNAPAQTIVSGPVEAILAANALFASMGHSATRLEVSQAFHSRQMDPAIEPLLRVARSCQFQAPRIPIISTLTGRLVSSDEMGAPEYWTRQLREPVRFRAAVEELWREGVRSFVELGARSVLLGAVAACLSPEALSGAIAPAGGFIPPITGSDPSVDLVPVLRADMDEVISFGMALGRLHLSGREVDWRGLFAESGALAVDLPSYAFQRQHYWLGEAAATAHPLLGEPTTVAGTGAKIFAVRVTRSSPSWVGDHQIFEETILPASALTELMWAAGRASLEGPLALSEVLISQPLVVPPDQDLELQVILEEIAALDASPSQAWRVRLFGLADGWTLHAGGLLREVQATTERVVELPPGPPLHLDAPTLYQAFAARGLRYGPSFRGLAELWRGEARSWARVVLPQEIGAEASRYEIHPALLDAAIHAVLATTGLDKDGAEIFLPFTVRSLRVLSAGHASAWVALTSAERTEEFIRADLHLYDEAGRPIAEVVGLELKRARRALVDARSVARQSFVVEWQPASAQPQLTGRWGVWGASESALLRTIADRLAASGAGPVSYVADPTATAGLDTVVSVFPPEEMGFDTASQRIRAGLSQLQAIAANAASPRVVWVTVDAVAALEGDPVSGLSASGLWGLARSARAELPDLALRCIDLQSGSLELLPAALSLVEEPECAVRGGAVLVPRLVREASAGSWSSARGGAVLITGGLGALGLRVAEWLVSEQGVLELVLTSRRGPEDPGAAEAVARLGALGGAARVVSCDVSDAASLESVLRSIPSLRGVIHAAGVLDDGVLSSQTGARVAGVLSPKVAGAWNLHRLCGDVEFFVLLSSVAGVLGTAGQAGYCAGNSFLDALAGHRRSQGLPGVSIAYGPWAESGMAASLDARGQARLSRLGFGALSSGEGLALLEAGLGSSSSLLVGMSLDVRRVRSPVPWLLRGLVRGPASAASGAAEGPLRSRLSQQGAEARWSQLLSLVQEEIASLLGLSSGSEVSATEPVQRLGADSLMSVELRNRLSSLSGLSLPTTFVFDYPDATSMARALLERLALGASAVEVVAPLVRSEEPIAIVSMACRYPGEVRSPEDLWALLKRGGDATSEVPLERWDAEAIYSSDPDVPGTSYCRRGGFIREVDRFDASFFGIAPREARSLDPQQRLLLEVSWELLERAGLSESSVLGSQTGVFVGLMYHDYVSRLGSALSSLDGYVTTGTAGSVMSGRLSYVLGLQGPSMTVDTACSSSLVTVHLACQSLRSGECDRALAGGVSLMQTASTFVEFSRLRGLSADGRCKSFSASADGVGWSEGCGMLLLRRLSDAERDGDSILAVIRGSAVNQDGRSQGLTAPNGPSQERVLLRALSSAGLRPEDVDYVEGHGTGTTLGDPIEAGALSRVFGGRSRPLLLGSLKSNLGHTQAAAGVGGVIKTVLSLCAEELPSTLHAEVGSPHVDWSGSGLELVREARSWKRGVRRRVGGVSSFGISGTNAHVLIEEGPSAPRTAPAAESHGVPLLVTGRSAAALNAQALALASYLEGTSVAPLPEVAATLALSRTHFEHRLSLAVEAGAELSSVAARLRSLAAERSVAGSSRGEVLARRKLAFVFTGQGSQYGGMGRSLYAAFPVFRAALDRALACLAPHVSEPLGPLLFSEPGSAESERLNETGNAQPALFALESSLVALWSSLGVVPEVVLGHSVGELSAAYAAGVLTLEDACALVAARGRLMQALPQGVGGMASVGASESVVLEHLQGLSDVRVAGVNGPESTVISGGLASLAQACGRFESLGLPTRRLAVSHAFHSHHMSPMLDAFEAVVSGVKLSAPRIPVVSNRSGAVATESELRSAGYWRDLVCAPVRYLEGVRTLESLSVTTVVECGPDGTLCGLGASSWSGSPASWHPSLRQRGTAVEPLIAALGGLFVRGHRVEWGALLEGPRRANLPTYAFQRERHWPDPVEHPLLLAETEIAESGGVLFTATLSLQAQPWLGDHRLDGHAVVPAAVLLDLVLAASERLKLGPVAQLLLEAPLVLPAAGARVQLAIDAPADGAQARGFTIYSRSAELGSLEPWQRHASGLLADGGSRFAEWIGDWPPRGALSLELDPYSVQDGSGLVYGPAFQGLERVWVDGSTLYAELRLPEALRAGAAGSPLHGALLDAALQPLALGLLGEPSNAGTALLPFELEGVSLVRPGQEALRARITLLEEGLGSLSAQIWLWDLHGVPVAEIAALRARRAQPPSAMSRLDWVVLPPSLVTSPGQAIEIDALSRTISPAGAFTPPIAGRDTTEAFPPEASSLVVRWRPGGDARQETLRGLTLLQEWLTDPRFMSTRMVWVTSGAVGAAIGDAVPDLSHAALWGLGRTAQLEHPERTLVLIDTDAASVGLLPQALGVEDEPQLALRSGQILGACLVRSVDSSLRVPEGPWSLSIPEPGQLDGLCLAARERAQLGSGEVRIEVRSAGLNFRDVLNALGMYPGESGPLGLECSGIVLEVGSEVSALRPGDRVVGLARGSFGAECISDARLVAPIPGGLSFAEAATIPLAFLTAYYGLFDLGALQAGERVLIHAAAGGVGMAAVQLAQLHGASVLGTASAEKHGVLRSLGLEDGAIASSRTLEFESQYSGGVDVVLNALSGSFVDASLRLLRAGGRFVEMGKTDIRDPAAIMAEHPGVRYQAFDVMEAGPARLSAVLGQLCVWFSEGKLKPLPHQSFDLRRAPEAFRWMAQAKHVGKVLLSPPRSLNVDGAVLITGGGGGLGALTAKHLVSSHGVKHLVLCSRRGLESEGASGLLVELLALGAQTVEISACDVSDGASVRALLSSIRAVRPLTAVFHAAGVLDDGVLTGLTPERLERVLAPKLDGALHLHALTPDVDAFVLYSSVAGTLGSPGQASYAAANALLNALAEHRRSQGSSALALAWGPWDEAGMAARLSVPERRRLKQQGYELLSPQRGLALLDEAMARPEAQLVPAALAEVQGSLQYRSRRRHTVPKTTTRKPTRPGGGSARMSELLSLPASQRVSSVLDLVREEVAQSLGLAGPQAVGSDRAFRDLGFDSLMSVELRNRLSAVTGSSLPATLLFDHPTPRAVAELLALGARSPVEAPRARPAREAIAIVSMACRFPGGVRSPDELWRVLREGRDVITEVPRGRWDMESFFDSDPEAAGKSYSRWGGFVEGIESFDAGFFGISPREAKSIDPQQRLLLETTWEALERGGYRQEDLSGSSTGVYVGLCGTEYQRAAMSDARSIDAYSLLGTVHSAIVGRLSYWLGLEGPNLSVDTACSSSLVALHLACNALRNGECEMALAGGVNLMLSPEGHVYFSRLRAMSPTGRCQAFSAEADGYVRSEGAGMVVLKRLSDAERDGDSVLALIRGTAVNQDGKSNGFTAPNGPSQQAVIRAALAQAEVSGSSVSYVECHGTGTALGDPIEVQALSAVYGDGRSGSLKIGSIKSNLGHTEGAAGIAGLMKVVLSLGRGELPRTLHAERLSPHIPWSSLPVEVTQSPGPWVGDGGPRRAGVSSFGFSGTNAHAIIEEAPPRAAKSLSEAIAPSESLPIVLSGRGRAALRGQAEALLSQVSSRPEQRAVDVALSLATERTHFEDRLALRLDAGSSLASALEGYLSSGAAVGGALSTAREGKLALLFTGQGSQRSGMGRGLYEGLSVFRSTVDEICVHLPEVKELLLSAPESALDETSAAQPALFALGVGLARQWSSWGVRPDVVLGHSIGEVVAAQVAGVFSLADACVLVRHRSRLMQSLAGGVMSSVEASEQEVSPLLVAGVSIAAINGPRSVVISGGLAGVERVESALAQLGRRTQRLRVKHAFHSSEMSGMQSEFVSRLGAIRFRAPQVPVVSNQTGLVATAESLCRAEYWADLVCQPVRFMDGVKTLESLGVVRGLECGPDGTLCGLASSVFDGATWSPSQRRGVEATAALTSALCAVHADGQAVDWSSYFSGLGGRTVELPTYAFDRKPYWLDGPALGSADVRSAGLVGAESPLLGAATPLVETDGYLFTGLLSTSTQPWLKDHQVFGETVVPGTAVLELALSAARALELRTVESLLLEAPLVLPADGGLCIQLQVGAPDAQGARPFTLHARGPEETAWTRHASGTLSANPLPGDERCPSWPPAGAEPLEPPALRARLAERGLVYGPAFCGLKHAWRLGLTAWAELELPGEADGAAQHSLHPALLDAALHVLASEGDAAYLPFQWAGVSAVGRGAKSLRAQIALQQTSPEQIDVSMELWDAAGRRVGQVQRLTARRARAQARPIEHLYRVEWESLLLPVGDSELERVELIRWAQGQVPVAAAQNALSGLQQRSTSDAPIAWITQGALAAVDGDAAAEIAHAALWGLGRAVQCERPEPRLLLVDTDGTASSEDRLLSAIAQALRQGEAEIALRRGLAYVPRLQRAQPSSPATGRLVLARPGQLESLSLTPLEPVSLGPGQVRVAVRAAGLNFRDVLSAMDIVSNTGGALGLEAAGVVLEVGDERSGLRPGDRVMGLVTGAFASEAVADARLLARIPQGVSFAEAASIPIAFLTALYALRDLAQLKAGERVLIHAAAGGVGMAAVTLARHLGAEVYGTSSPEKWPALRGLELPEDHVATSRDPEFEAQFAAQTAGQGVDVVLAALSGELVDASLRLLPRGGRFLEMGKTDVRDAAAVALKYPGVRYRAFDLLQEDPELLGALLGEVVALLERGVIAPLPRTCFDLRAAPAAFRFMAQARHVGKVVLTVGRALDPAGTVLITGGTGALGQIAARALVQDGGARHLLIATRSGLAAPGAADLVTELLGHGAATVEVVAADLSRWEAVARLVASVPPERALTAVVHCAGLIQDGTIETQDQERLAAVFAPKLDAALHLDRATERADLAAFVLFSSSAGVFGSAGQANYCAANRALDALAQDRQHRGLPATALAFGPWEQTGMAARLSTIEQEQLGRRGLKLLPQQDGQRLFTAALGRPEPVLVPIALTRAGSEALLRKLHPQSSPQRQVDRSPLSRILERPAKEQRAAFVALVGTETQRVLGLSPADFAAERSFESLGLDSLMGVELRNRLASLVGAPLPATLVFDYPTPAKVADFLFTKFAPEEEAELEEREIRHLVSSLTIAELKESGLLDRLLSLARQERGRPERSSVETPATADEMDAELDAILGDVP